MIGKLKKDPEGVVEEGVVVVEVVGGLIEPSSLFVCSNVNGNFVN